MKSSELKRLVEQYKALKSQKPHHQKTRQKLEEIEHRYYHETGQSLESHIEDELKK